MSHHEILHYIPIAGEHALADFNHPDIVKKAAQLTYGITSDRDRFWVLHEFVRDEIPFGFVPTWDQTPASQVLKWGKGHCNLKSTLLLALCRAAGIPAVVHFGIMDLRILEGLTPWWFDALSPKEGAHGYLEVELDGVWSRVDSYIVDRALCLSARKALTAKNRNIGLGIAMRDHEPFNCTSCIDGEGFVQMGGLIRDIGIFEDPADFYATPDYPEAQQLKSPFMKWGYRLAVPVVNRKVEKLRTLNSPLST